MKTLYNPIMILDQLQLTDKDYLKSKEKIIKDEFEEYYGAG